MPQQPQLVQMNRQLSCQCHLRLEQLGQFLFLSSSKLQQPPTSSHEPVASIQQADGGFMPEIPSKYVSHIESGEQTRFQWLAPHADHQSQPLPEELFQLASLAQDEHAEYFSNINNLLATSVSQQSIDTGLSSVLQRNIFTYYPDCGAQMFKQLFNYMVQPRLIVKKGFNDLRILFCYDAATQVSKKQKLTPILSKKVSKKLDSNISSFFIKPTVDPTFHKAPNETFSFSAALQTHQNTSKPDADITVNKPQGTTTSTLE
ncbi:Hypothetical predicted protein [Paramuricea clavata]|uniref:Uncharacterized protein n=1 Tax=Paramuricea clavata TaxID=317549 RepID=A0A7D9IHM6_PARCT|nr:Hypothetical predicted protein [Paramuricea clavata]